MGFIADTSSKQLPRTRKSKSRTQASTLPPDTDASQVGDKVVATKPSTRSCRRARREEPKTLEAQADSLDLRSALPVVQVPSPNSRKSQQLLSKKLSVLSLILEDTCRVGSTPHSQPNAPTQIVPVVMRHVTFQSDLAISTTPSHDSLPSGPLQYPTLATPPPPSELGPDSESQSGAETEDFDLTGSGTDSGSVRPTHTKRKNARAVPSPRACRTLKDVRRGGPAGNKHRGRALDIWPFFVREDEENVCVFCKYVTLS